jgi:hypothetical protein
MATCDQTGTAHWVCGAAGPRRGRPARRRLHHAFELICCELGDLPILVTADTRSHPDFSGSAGGARLMWQYMRSASGCTVSRPAPPEGRR